MKNQFTVHVMPVSEGKEVEFKQTCYALDEATQLRFIIDLASDQSNPAIDVTKTSEKENVEFSSRTKTKVASGWQITVNKEAVYNFFILTDGTIKTEDLFKQLVQLAGDSISSAAFMRGSLKKFQQFAHALRQNLTTYKNFYGELSDDQKQWMRDNTNSFEEDQKAAKERAEKGVKNDN